ncbi:antitoxin Xre-like helix-turn-helix domain-containing protein [Alteromonas facilis]|uniref:antitoxin Xre-like helix-turn-helix domain-containing protein n=1 Tax=Alteromonas facilis TaxID=2048004 RepID=UPI000C287DBE|nr:antitoxin Xre-like helix-turn-helix domain-containing protein [Alteromonas facilis]
MNTIIANTQTEEAASPEQLSKGLHVAINVLRKWNATPAQMSSILGVSTATINRVKRKEIVRLSRDQADRASYVLNIHASLRTVFENPKNIYGFVNMENHNPFFNGRTPLSLMVEGSMANLYEVFKRINALEMLHHQQT